MPVTYRVMVSGFDEAGRLALAPCFSRRSLIAYLPVEGLSDADLVVVASDDAAASAAALQLLQPGRVLFVGDARPEGARWHVPLPLAPSTVLAQLDELVASEKPAPHAFTDPFLSLLRPEADRLSFHGFGDRARAAIATPRGAAAAEARRVAAAVAFPPVIGLPAYDAEPEAPASVEEGRATAAASAESAPLERPAKTTMRAAVRRAQREAQPARGPAVNAALVVEHHAPNRLLLAELLGSFGFQPVSASTIEQAERQLVERAFGVVFLGLVDDPEGEVAGIELCHRIKQQVLALPALPPRVVMVWPRPRAADHVRARLAGCDHFITGPIGRGPVAQALEAIGVPMPSDPRGRGLEAGGAADDIAQRSVSTTGA